MNSSLYCAITVAMFIGAQHEGMFTSKTKNSSTNLPFSSLLMPDILAEQIITSRRTLTLFQTDVSAHLKFLNETNCNGGLKNFMYAVIEV